MNTLVDALLDAIRLESGLVAEQGEEMSSVSDDLRNQLELWGAGICRIVVVGEVKRGKSTFINALLGHRNLVPVGDNITTSTVFKVHYDQSPGYRVHFTKESGKEPLFIDINDKKSIENYGTEIGNPGNFAEVDYIEAGVNSEVLKSGVVLIDTPGLGGIYKHHKEITYTYIPRADAVFFVLASDQPPIGQMEVEYLKTISKITPFIYFVQTRFTEASSVEARDELKERNLDLISRVLDIPKNRIPYFVLDSELKLDAEESRDLEDLRVSRFPQLMAYIKSVLQSNQQKMLATRAIWSMAPTLNHLSELLTTRRAFLNANTKEKLKELEMSIASKKNELEEWRASKKADILIDSINKSLDEIFTRISGILQQKCGIDSPIRRELVAELLEAKDISGLELHKNLIQTKYREEMSRIVYEVDHQVEQEVSCLLQTMVRDVLRESLGENISDKDFEIENRPFEPISFRKWDEEGYSYMGIHVSRSTKRAIDDARAFAGTSVIVSAALGLLSIYASALPILVFGASLVYSKYRYGELEFADAKDLSIKDIDEGLKKAQDRILTSIKKKYKLYTTKIKDQIESYVKQREGALKKDYEDVQQRMRGKADELLNEQTTQQQRERRFARIQAAVDRWNDSIS